MKKIFASLIMVLMVPFLANAATYTEGKQYTQVSEQASKSPELRE